jgi:hypothetical protein
MQRLRSRQKRRFLLDPETQTFHLDRRTAAARLTTFALASNPALSAVWLKSGGRTLDAIRRRIDRAGVIAHRRKRLLSASPSRRSPRTCLAPLGSRIIRHDLGPEIYLASSNVGGGAAKKHRT